MNEVFFTQNNSVLCETIECENNDYFDMNFTIDLIECKISDKLLSNHNTYITKFKYYFTNCTIIYKYIQLIRHKNIIQKICFQWMPPKFISKQHLFQYKITVEMKRDLNLMKKIVLKTSHVLCKALRKLVIKFSICFENI